MEINRQGQVPVLKDGYQYIVDSSQIIRHLDNQYGGPVLLPDATTDAGAKVAFYHRLLSSIDLPILTYGTVVHMDRLSVNHCHLPPQLQRRMIATARSDENLQLLSKYVEAHPHLESTYRNKVKAARQFKSDIGNVARVTEEVDKTRTVLHKVNEELRYTDTTWLCGEDFTVADISLAILLLRTLMIGQSHTTWSGGKLPSLEAYYTRLYQRPSFQTVCVRAMAVADRVRFYSAHYLSRISAAAAVGFIGISLAGVVLLKSR